MPVSGVRHANSGNNDFATISLKKKFKGLDKLAIINDSNLGKEMARSRIWIQYEEDNANLQ